MDSTLTKRTTPPDLKEIRDAREQLGTLVRETPVWQWKSHLKDHLFGASTKILLKLELFQYGGSFKPRGALTNMLNLTEAELAKGVTAVSAGNHAIAVGYAAKVLNTTAKVVMPKSANPARVEKCKSYDTEVILTDDVHKAFDEVYRIEEEEGMSFVHPFEGYNTALGTATLGYEFIGHIEDLDAVIVPVGGGGLIAGVANAVKLANPNCKVYGVEPEGAMTMSLSLQSGKPESIEKVNTIADSLGAPYAAPYTFSLCQKYVDEVVIVDDQQICDAIALLFYDMKLSLEPAGAAATAALFGPLKNSLEGKKVGLMICGSNIDHQSFCEYLGRGDKFYQDLLNGA